MESTQPKLPTEAVELYNKFIHGGMSRRAFMNGIQRLAVGGLAASAMVEALMPNYALGQQVSRTDDRIKTSYQTVPSPKGNGRDRKSTRLNSSHAIPSRMPSSA